MVCLKIVFVLSHGQSNIESGFSVNKEILRENLQEKSLITQRLMYHSLNCSDLEAHQFVVSLELTKSCKFAYARYKADLDRQKEEKVVAEKVLKRAHTTQELQDAKKQKVELTNSINTLKEGLIKETLAADKTKELASVAKAAAFFHGIKAKEKELEECHKKITELDSILNK